MPNPACVIAVDDDVVAVALLDVELLLPLLSRWLDTMSSVILVDDGRLFAVGSGAGTSGACENLAPEEIVFRFNDDVVDGESFELDDNEFALNSLVASFPLLSLCTSPSRDLFEVLRTTLLISFDKRALVSYYLHTINK